MELSNLATHLNGLKSKKYLLLLIFAPSLVRCENDQEGRESQLGWPDGGEALVNHLNSWDQKQLVSYNQGKIPDDSKVGIWVTRHIYEIEKLGFTCEWSEEKEAYIIQER